jgi:hypothetical protein
MLVKIRYIPYSGIRSPPSDTNGTQCNAKKGQWTREETNIGFFYQHRCRQTAVMLVYNMKVLQK